MFCILPWGGKVDVFQLIYVVSFVDDLLHWVEMEQLINLYPRLFVPRTSVLPWLMKNNSLALLNCQRHLVHLHSR